MGSHEGETASLATSLSNIYTSIHKSIPPESSRRLKEAAAEIEANYDPSTAIQPGSTFPSFRLPDATNALVSSTDLLSRGPLLITFYRGECHHPELPSAALTAVEKNELELGVLSDLGNGLAKRLGIFLVQPEVMRGLLEEIGVDWEARNGVEELGVPVPATFLVDQEGVVRNSYVEGDYTKRLEPAVAMEWIEAL